MRKEPLLLPSASRIVLVEADPAWALWLNRLFIAIGILMVVIGLADVSSRLATYAAGDRAVYEAFAPAATTLPR